MDQYFLCTYTVKKQKLTCVLVCTKVEGLLYLFAHTVDYFKVFGVRQERVCVNCDVVMEKWHHI